MKRGSIVLYLLAFVFISAHAQKKQGDDNYARFNYRAAIRCYKRAISSDPKDTASLIRLANCYGILREYDNAEIYYAQAVALSDIPPYVYMSYGKILKNNGKLDQAREQFAIYQGLYPNDTAARDEIRYCDNLKKKSYLAYQVNTVDGINSKYSDFGPTLFKDNVVFVSDRGADMVNFNKSSNTGGNYFTMFITKPAGNSFSSPGDFTIDKSAGNDCNIGPATFTSDGKAIYYTQVNAIRKKGFVNQAKIYYSTMDADGKWGKPQPFQYNSDSYSVMDPSISEDGQWFYFASNMPGGYGGSDIYECQKSGDGWSKPVNLGSQVNTPGNEVFPYIRKDGTLFFSSDRHFSYGGLDIFSVEKFESIWADVENLGPDINSSTDDFGICFNTNGRTGYFSSNRKDGQGADDIYSFFYIGDYRPMKGKLLSSYNVNNIVTGATVHILNDSGRVIATGKTDLFGNFVFKTLDPNSKYSVQVDESDPRFFGKKRFYLADSTGKIVGVTVQDIKMGKFMFRQLPPDITRLPMIQNMDKEMNLAGSLLHGDSSKPVANVQVNMLNENGEVVASAVTNEFGAFVFTNLPPDNNYVFSVNANDSQLPPRTRIVLNNKNGDVIKVFYVGNDGKFRFTLLASDSVSLKRMKVDDVDLRLTLKSTLLDADKRSMAGVKVNLVDRYGQVIESTTTDGMGQFSFSNLPPDKEYFEQVDASDPKLKGMKKLYISDSRGNIVHALDQSTGFKFEVLPSDKVSIGNIYVNDPWLTALNLKHRAAAGNTTGNSRTNNNGNNSNNGQDEESLNIIENIYYDYQKWDILPSAARVLDKVVSVMKSDQFISIELDSYTDPRGTDEFNMELSQKRADAAVDYIAAHGIDRRRLKGVGFGKTHLLNNCGDPGVTCTEEQLAINRRTEFKVRRR
ncbi:MAG TPA: OmpA family protein [Bacteroidia bacterium]|nr:OmpA family protein [Bacteroidia bacterium]